MTLGISASQGSSSSSFLLSTSARDSPTGSMSSRLRVFVGLTSALLHHPRFPTADSSKDNDQHRSHRCSLLISHFSVQVEVENVVFEIDWNEFVRSIPLTNFSK